MVRGVGVFLVLLICAAGVAAADEEPRGLSELIEALGDVEIETHAAEEYAAAAEAYRGLLEELGELDREEIEGLDAVDLDLLERYLEIRLFEIEELRLHTLIPNSYFRLWTTDGLFVRLCAQPDKAVSNAVEELEKLPEILANAKENLARPARTWTENAIYNAWYADHLLERLDEVCVDDPELKLELLTVGKKARQAVTGYADWMKSELLPRSDRSPAWRPDKIERYQFRNELLTDWGVDEMIRFAEADEAATMEEMQALADRIHPSGDLATVWDLMKDEAPPWDEVWAMAERYVELADEWLRGEGAHLVDIPERFDYGVALTSPMGRRTLSFGGATYGPTLAGRISGYYVLTPLEERLSEEEKASRIRSYNPYWTHVISYHEWLGHNVQRAIANEFVDRPMHRRFRSSYLSQAWSFYLEKLLEDEGYYEDVLPHMEALKTRMARLQMRMWRIQRILTKLKMAKGEMTFDQAVQAYIDKIGMEPTNAFIEVQRDSQSPSPPGREIIGERVILDMRAEYSRRFGEHYRIKDFHEALLRYGELPLPVVRDLMFGDY